MSEEFTEMLLRQLDLRSEADNLRRFRANFARAGGGAPPVDFPDPVGGYVARPALCRVVRGEVGGGPEGEAFP